MSGLAAALWMVPIFLAARASAAPADDYPVKIPASPYLILGSAHLETPPIDATLLCIPDGLDSAWTEITRIAIAGDLKSANILLGEWGASESESGALLEALIGARAAEDRKTVLIARKRLAVQLGSEGTPGGRSCLLLEKSRLELKLEWYPEASASAVYAARLVKSAELEEGFAQAADFFRAEARYLAGWWDDADTIFRPLSRQARPRIAAAARLRVADIAFDNGHAAEVLQDFETLLKRASAFGASLESWAIRVSEAAIAAGRLKPAAAWAQRALDVTGEVTPSEQDPLYRAAIEIRLADLETAAGDVVASRERLRRIADRFPEDRLGILAEVRIVDLEIDDRVAEKRLEILRAATQCDDDLVSRYALGVLAHEQRDLGQLNDALSSLTRLAYEARSSWIAPYLSDDIDAVLEAVVSRSKEASDCMDFIRIVGGRYGILANRARELGPLLRIGACYEELGLPVIALGVYRALARSFPDQVARDVALPLARSALAARDVGLVRITAASHVRRSKKNVPYWLLLLAEAEIQDGKVQRATNLLRPLVEKLGPKGAELRTVVAFAQAISQLPLSNKDVERLIKAFDALQVPTIPREHGRYGEALMIIAGLELKRGRTTQARARYLVAQELLPAGGMRAEASYWIAALDRDLVSASSRFELAASEEAGMWQRLARFEVEMVSLRSFLNTWPEAVSRK
jgi:hypothetical protein